MKYYPEKESTIENPDYLTLYSPPQLLARALVALWSAEETIARVQPALLLQYGEAPSPEALLVSAIRSPQEPPDMLKSLADLQQGIIVFPSGSILPFMAGKRRAKETVVSWLQSPKTWQQYLYARRAIWETGSPKDLTINWEKLAAPYLENDPPSSLHCIYFDKLQSLVFPKSQSGFIRTSLRVRGTQGFFDDLAQEICVIRDFEG